MNSVSLLKGTFRANNPTLLQTLCIKDLCAYISGEVCRVSSLVSRLCNMGVSPLIAAFTRQKHYGRTIDTEDGIVDSIRQLIMHENFMKYHSDEHTMTMMLLKAF